jgi:pimeloyl-ACP methyl ester carboxylesterase
MCRPRPGSAGGSAAGPEPAGELAYVIAHGFTGSASGAPVRAICDRLAGRGAAVVALDFRGHGRSSGQTSIGVLEELDVAAGVSFLRAQGYSRICVAGWSMGGSVVIRYAALRPDPSTAVAAVVSVSSPGLWYERGTTAMRRVHLAAETAGGRAVARWLLRTRIGRAGWDELPASPVELAGRIAPIPYLIVHGDADPYFPIRHPQALAAAAPGSSLWIEPGMGHAEAATTPELVDRIDAWVRRVAVRRSASDGPRPTGHGQT